MTTISTCLLVGGNLAGGRAAEALRQAGFEGRIVLVGAEADRPYERPPLSKEFLRGESAAEKLFLRPADYYEQQQIELRTDARAVGLDSSERAVQLESGERISFDRLLIATGTSVQRLVVPGADLEGVFYLRTLRDAERLQTELAPGRKVVVVGAGFIGAEVAASCRQQGLDVTMIEAMPVPLQRALGVEVGQICADFHREQGVDLRTGTGIQSLRGHRRVEEVITTSGEAVSCDFVVVGIGVVPEIGWLAGSGIEIDNGVVVDEFCETSVPGIFAAGDVANWWHPTLQERLRVEHFDNAQNQGVAAAQAMIGQRNAYAPTPYFWSDQYDLNLQYVGHASRWDRVVLRGSVSQHSFTAFYLVGSEIRAALGVNRFKDIGAARRLIQTRATVTAEQLADDQVNLKQLLPA